MLKFDRLKSLVADKKVLFLVSAFNGATQAVYSSLGGLFGQVAVHSSIDIKAIKKFGPDMILCPYLLDYIPEEVYEAYPCFIFHPGPANVGGPSSLAHSILRGDKTFSISLIQAAKGWDKGPLWAEEQIELKAGSLAKNYRCKVIPKAAGLFTQALVNYFEGAKPLQRGEYRYEAAIKPRDLTFDWTEDAQSILSKIWAGDNQPGASATFMGQDCSFFSAWASTPSDSKSQTVAGEVLNKKNGALEIACGNGAIWVARIQPPESRKNRAHLSLPEEE
ncbi:MAG: hypothetical protein QNL04_11435 [SAR324 cluster bacterium]|nr:hypothetical protein [SAR324 cluster bacterium]